MNKVRKYENKILKFVRKKAVAGIKILNKRIEGNESKIKKYKKSYKKKSTTLTEKEKGARAIVNENFKAGSSLLLTIDNKEQNVLYTSICSEGIRSARSNEPPPYEYDADSFLSIESNNVTLQATFSTSIEPRDKLKDLQTKQERARQPTADLLEKIEEENVKVLRVYEEKYENRCASRRCSNVSSLVAVNPEDEQLEILTKVFGSPSKIYEVSLTFTVQSFSISTDSQDQLQLNKVIQLASVRTSLDYDKERSYKEVKQYLREKVTKYFDSEVQGINCKLEETKFESETLLTTVVSKKSNHLKPVFEIDCDNHGGSANLIMENISIETASSQYDNIFKSFSQDTTQDVFKPEIIQRKSSGYLHKMRDKVYVIQNLYDLPLHEVHTYILNTSTEYANIFDATSIKSFEDLDTFLSDSEILFPLRYANGINDEELSDLDILKCGNSNDFLLQKYTAIVNGEPRPKYRLVVVTAEVFEDAMRQFQIEQYEVTYTNYFPRNCRMFVHIPVYRGGFINRRDNKDRGITQ